MWTNPRLARRPAAALGNPRAAPARGRLYDCVTNHHWNVTATASTGVAHKGMIAAAEWIAATMIDLLTQPTVLAQVQQEFQERTARTPWTSLLQERPAADLPGTRLVPARPTRPGLRPASCGRREAFRIPRAVRHGRPAPVELSPATWRRSATGGLSEPSAIRGPRAGGCQGPRSARHLACLLQVAAVDVALPGTVAGGADRRSRRAAR